MQTVRQSTFEYDIDEFYLNEDMTNKLFCTFTSGEDLDQVLDDIQRRYQIIYNKIFVLYAKEQQEYICTYNVDTGNVMEFLDNTILVHRKKQTNTLYTINALNSLIRSLNQGHLNKSYQVNWADYRNSILLTKADQLKHVKTTLFKIITT